MVKVRAAAALAAIGVLLCATACGGSDEAGPAVPFGASDPVPAGAGTSNVASDSAILWSADMEEGTLEDWTVPSQAAGDSEGGGLYNSGGHDARVSREHAHSGSYSLRARIWDTPEASPGVRAFRWQEAREHRELYYSAWFFIPAEYRRTQDPSLGAFWNVFQFKSRSSDGRTDPLWALYIRRGSDGGQYIHAGWGWGGTEVPGPFDTSPLGGRFFEQFDTRIPIGRWFELEAYLRQSKDFDGRLTIWQDGEELFDFTDARTSYPHAPDGQNWNANNEWSVNNYSDGLSPSPATIYIDDAEIRTQRASRR